MTVKVVSTALMRDEPSVHGVRVRWARNLRGLLAQDVAHGAHVSVATLSRIERADASTLSWETAMGLASALSVPLDWLTEPPRSFASEQGALFRANSKMTKRSQEMVKTWKSLLAEMLATLDRTIRLLPIELPVNSIRETPDPIEDAAKVRDALEWRPDAPGGHLMRAVESLGVFIGVHSFDEELHLRNHDASSGWYTSDTGRPLPLMLCREHSSWERTRFSVAHELGHLVMHRYGSSASREDEATAFAAELLMPHRQLRREWPTRLTIQSLLPLKLRWGVSIAALIQQGFRHGLVSSDRRVSLFKQLSNGRDPATGQRWRVREPGADDRPVERPLLIANALEVAYGVPPNLNQLFDELPETNDEEWYGAFLSNFDCGWSRARRHPSPGQIVEQHLAAQEKVVSMSDFLSTRRSGQQRG